jgi:threonine/homoserine/homoserine lactone efflux protein
MLLAFLLKGVLVGIIIAVPAGPVGVLCIRRTIFHGRLAGFASGLGASTADAVFGVIAGFGLTVVSDLLLDYQDWLRLGGAGFLLYIGIRALAAGPIEGEQSERDPEGLLADYASTFVLTITNPITILAFLAIVIGGSLALFAWRAGSVGLGGSFALVSRESMLLANNIVLIVAMASVLLGTLYPLFLDVVAGQKVSTSRIGMLEPTNSDDRAGIARARARTT